MSDTAVAVRAISGLAAPSATTVAAGTGTGAQRTHSTVFDDTVIWGMALSSGVVSWYWATVCR